MLASNLCLYFVNFQRYPGCAAQHAVCDTQFYIMLDGRKNCDFYHDIIIVTFLSVLMLLIEIESADDHKSHEGD